MPGGYVETPSADPALVYQDILVGLDPANGVDNGEPTMHARCLDAVAPEPGDRALHIGGGTDRIRSLHRGTAAASDSCWHAGDGWWLSTTPL